MIKRSMVLVALVFAIGGATPSYAFWGSNKDSKKDEKNEERSDLSEKSIPRDKLLNATIEGIRLHMSTEEVLAILNADGWQNGWSDELPGKSFSETITTEFSKDGRERSLALFRYKTLDGPVRIYGIQYSRRYSEYQTLDVLVEKLKEKFGEPTKFLMGGTGKANFTYYSDYKDDDDLYKVVCEFQSREGCSDYKQRKKKQIEMEITATEKSVNIKIWDENAKVLERKKIKDYEKNKKDEEARERTAKEKLDF